MQPSPFPSASTGSPLVLHGRVDGSFAGTAGIAVAAPSVEFDFARAVACVDVTTALRSTNTAISASST